MTLADAFRALEERKKSVLGDEPGVTFTHNSETHALIMSGFDLDAHEVDNLAAAAGNLFYIMGEQIPLPIAIKGAWVEGLLMGCMFSRLKEQEEKHEKSN